MDEQQKSELVRMVEEQFAAWDTARKDIEKEWETAYYNYLGQYDPEVQGQWRKSEANRPEGSQIFLKITGNKVRGAMARLYDVYADPDFALKAEVSDEDASPSVKLVASVLRTVGLGELAEKLTSKDKKKRLQAHQEVLDIATEEMKAWYRRIDLPTYLGDFVLNAAWSGIGILRTPISIEKLSAGYSPKGVVAEVTTGPGKEVIEPWCFYPDPKARNAQEGEGFVILHRYTPAELRRNAKALGWDMKVVTKLLKKDDSGRAEEWERTVDDAKKDNAETKDNRFRVKEFWGTVKVADLKKHGVKVEVPNVESEDHVEAVVVISGGELLHAKVNPFYPVPYRPITLFQWFPKAGSLWGEGVPASFDDVQRCLNGAGRMLLDTTAQAANPMWEIDPNLLEPGQDLSTVYAGKKWVKRSGQGGPAITPIYPPNVTAVCLQAIALFEKWSDDRTEVTAQSVGQDAPTSAKTATGQAILQNNANALTKARIERLDNVIEQMVAWDYRYMVEIGEAPPLPVTISVAGTRKASEANAIRTQRLTEALTVLPTLGQLPARFPEGSAAAKIDGEKLVKRWLETLELEDVWDEELSTGLPLGGVPGLENAVMAGAGGMGEGPGGNAQGMPPEALMLAGGGEQAPGGGANAAGIPGITR